MCDNLQYWARRGVDGFRIDAVDMLLEDRQQRSNPPNPEYLPTDAPDNVVIQQYTRNQRGNHRLMAAIRDASDAFPERVLLGEMYLPVEELVTYYGTQQRPELHLPLNLQLLFQNWDADSLQQLLEQYYRVMPEHGWPSWSFGNHDVSRLASRAPGDQARVAAMLLLTLRGTPTLYYGDEIGMRDSRIPSDKAQDPQHKSWPGHSRDVARTPMQWDSSPLTGFTRGQPWLPVAPNAATTNVAAAQRDPRSLLALYRRLIEVRRAHPGAGSGGVAPPAAPLAARRLSARLTRGNSGW